MTEISVIKMDITKIGEKADAIVNAANETLLGGGGVDRAIHLAAGPKLLEECRTLNGCNPGDAKYTKAYNLNNKFIIHTVGPRYRYDPTPKETLTSCYTKCLEIAEKLGLESIAFPSISTGAFGFPVDEAAEICANVLFNFKYKSIKRVYMCIIDNVRSLAAYTEAFNKYR